MRVVAATHRDLRADVQNGRFRADLYYRLAVFPLEVPPLRARRGDVALLAAAFARCKAVELHRPVSGITPAALERLEGHSWPGNVRELLNVIERAVIVARGSAIDVDDLPRLEGAPPRSEPVAESIEHAAGTLEEMERAHVLRVLEERAWVIEGPAGAAAALGLHPSTLRSRMGKLGIQRPGRRS